MANRRKGTFSCFSESAMTPWKSLCSASFCTEGQCSSKFGGWCGAWVIFSLRGSSGESVLLGFRKLELRGFFHGPAELQPAARINLHVGRDRGARDRASAV